MQIIKNTLDQTLKKELINAVSIPDLWFQAVYNILDNGKRFVIDRGSYAGQTRLEYDYFIGHILNPGYGSGTHEILPNIPPHINIPNPVEFEYIYGGPNYERSYIECLLTPTKLPNESYTYGERLTQAKIDWWKAFHCYDYEEIIIQDRDLWKDPKVTFTIEDQMYINQVEFVIRTYKNKGFRNNQMVMQIAQPSDMILCDPPCLRSIDTRIQDNKLHFFVYFRSWDLWGGLPANLAAIQFLKEYMATEIGVADGEMIVESKGLHLYGYAEKLAQLRCMKGEKK